MLEFNRCCACAKEYSSSDVEDYRAISITLVPLKVFEKIVAKKLCHFLNATAVFLLSFYIGGAWEHVMLCSHCLSIYRLLWSEARKECLFSWNSQLHLIVLVTAMCCIS